jgi:hypothetical protein
MNPPMPGLHPDDATPAPRDSSLDPHLGEALADLLQWLESSLSHLDGVTGHERCELLFCARTLQLEAAVVMVALEKAIREITAAPAGTDVPALEIENYLLLQRFDRAPEWRRQFLRHWIQDGGYRGQEITTISALLYCVASDHELSTGEMRALAANWFEKYELESSRMASWAVYSLSLLGLQDVAAQRAARILAQRQSNGSWDGDTRRTIGCLYPLVAAEVAHPAALMPSLAYILRRARSGVLQDTEHRGLLLRILGTLRLIPPEDASRLQRTLELLKRIFVSYSHEDRNFVSLLTDRLAQEGYRVWIDSLALRAGDSFELDIRRAIQEARFMLIVLSRRSIQSEWVRLETTLALERRAREEDLRIIPLFIDDSAIPQDLGDLLGVDFRSDFDTALQDLLLSLNQVPQTCAWTRTS